MKRNTLLLIVLSLLWSAARVPAQIASTSGADDLIIARDGQTQATVIVSPEAGRLEKQAALDLQIYIEKMSAAKPALANTAETIPAALQSAAPVFIVGAEALKAMPSLQLALDKVKKKDPFLRANAIVVRRAGNRVLLAGTDDESHYFAVSHLLHLWGCRWYLPGELGESIPQHGVLRVGQLDFSYAPPFEIRRALNRRVEGFEEYERRNFLSSASTSAHMGSLHDHLTDLAPEGETFKQVPLAADATAQHIADKIADRYAAGVSNIPIAPSNVEFSAESDRDQELRANIVNKYYGMVSSTDALMELYNKVAKILREKYPQSPTKLVGIGMASTFFPPQRHFKPEPNLMMWLVPADVDPNHAMDDERSPFRREWQEIMARWSQVMEGRIAIYDYEEAILVWRDLPHPRHHIISRDMKQFRQAGILGFTSEARGSLAVNFLNIYFRAQLMWNPAADVDAMLTEFYQRFYGPAAQPMAAYWNTLSQAWEDTVVTEHEYFIAPAVYTPQVVSTLRRHLEAAEAVVQPLQAKADSDQSARLFVERLKIARLGFNILNHYMAMISAGAGEVDYPAAVESGQRGLAALLALAKFNPQWTPTVKAKADTIEPGGNVALWAGEVQQYRTFSELTDGTKGRLLVKTPLEWAFRRDPNDTGLASGWAYKPIDLSFWNANKDKFTLETRKDYPTTEWEMLRTDLYPQAQGVLHPDWQSFTGHLWYRTTINLTPEQAQGKVHLMFPGLFNEGWLYVNGYLAQHRPFERMWWNTDYRFEWDVDLSGKLQPGENTITLRLHNPHHMGGIFRRPFLYQPIP